jgi:hypothetical protein
MLKSQSVKRFERFGSPFSAGHIQLFHNLSVCPYHNRSSNLNDSDTLGARRHEARQDTWRLARPSGAVSRDVYLTKLRVYTQQRMLLRPETNGATISHAVSSDLDKKSHFS